MNPFSMLHRASPTPSMPALPKYSATGADIIHKPTAQKAAPISQSTAPTTNNQRLQAVSQPVDPYAQWGGQGQFNAYNDQYRSGIANVGVGARDAFGGLHSQLQGNAEGLYNSLLTGQQGIDTSRANNELNRMNGIQDIVGYVRNGIRQGFSRLAQGNAVDSSAAGALGSAYSQLGNSKARGVNNQAAIQSNTLDQQQSALNRQRDQGVNDFHRTRDQAVNAIGADVRGKLAALDQTAAGLSLPDRISIDQEKQRIVNEGLQGLSDVDSWLQNQLATVNPQTQDQVIAAANNLRTLGTGTGTPFDTGQFDQQQVVGPSVDQLPIFVSRRRRV